MCVGGGAAPLLPTVAIAGVAEFCLVWFVAPIDLFTRFFVWLVPSVAVAIVFGAVVVSERGRRWTMVAWLACGLIVGAQLFTVLPGAGRSVVADRQAAAVLTRAARTGARVCVLSTSWEILLGYLDAKAAATRSELSTCDVVAGIFPDYDRPLLPLVTSMFPHRLELRGTTFGGAVFTNADTRCLTAPTPSCWRRG